jgi:hypothetical protein
MREDQGNSGKGLNSADFGNGFGSRPPIVKHAEPQSLVDENVDTQISTYISEIIQYAKCAAENDLVSGLRFATNSFAPIRQLPNEILFVLGAGLGLWRRKLRT